MLYRLSFLALALGSEALVASLFFDNERLSPQDGLLVGLVRGWAPWAVRAAICFAAIFATFAYLQHRDLIEKLSKELDRTRINRWLAGAHLGAIALFAWLSSALYGGREHAARNLIAGAWTAAGVAAAATIALALIPARLWIALIHRTGKLSWYALGAAVAACYAGAMSWALWEPAAKVTFQLVKFIVSPIVPELIVQPAIRRIGTTRFTVRIAPECSGLEGIALLLAFGVLWLWVFRDEIRFPRSLLLLPIGVVILFLLNAVRIAALILIGYAGAPDIAAGGFHSQAGWIAFSGVALGLSIGARRLPWISTRSAAWQADKDSAANPTAAYLVPFLAILAAGIASRAASGNFEWLYSLRFFLAAGVLWFFRRRYSAVDWKFTWLGPAAGVLVFGLWIGMDRLTGIAGHPMPAALAAAPTGFRISWIALRIAAAVTTVPIAEELAFRGFLLRRFISADFEAVSFRTFTWFALLASAALFGALHGRRWMAGVLAGLVYAAASLRTGRLGEAVAAHATTNALLAAYVLLFDNWTLW